MQQQCFDEPRALEIPQPTPSVLARAREDLQPQHHGFTELRFPCGLSLGKDKADTCLWQRILGNSDIAVVLLPAPPVPEPWKARAVPVAEGGARHAGQHCQEKEG